MILVLLARGFTCPGLDDAVVALALSLRVDHRTAEGSSALKRTAHRAGGFPGFLILFVPITFLRWHGTAWIAAVDVLQTSDVVILDRMLLVGIVNSAVVHDDGVLLRRLVVESKDVAEFVQRYVVDSVTRVRLVGALVAVDVDDPPVRVSPLICTIVALRDIGHRSRCSRFSGSFLISPIHLDHIRWRIVRSQRRRRLAHVILKCEIGICLAT